jgi:hypothetical protein
MLALVLGLPMVQFIFKPSIQNELTKTAAVDQKDARRAALSFYEPRIKAANAKIAAIQARETALESRVSKFTRLSGCESDDPSCSRTHRTGCGHWCKYYARQASIARAALAADRPVDRKTIAALKAQIDDWRAAESRETSQRVDAIANNQDLLARAQALASIEERHPEVSRYVLFVLGLFVCLDLVALVMKLSHLFVSGAVYEQVAAELRERDRLEADRLRAETSVLRERILADTGVDKVRIEFGRARSIAEEESKLTPGARRHVVVPADADEARRSRSGAAGLAGAGGLAALSLLVVAFSAAAVLLN